jgi:hypothetical protein
MSGDGYRYLLNERAFRGLNIQRALHLQQADTTFPATNTILHIADNEGAVGFSDARLTAAGSLRLPGTLTVAGATTFEGAVAISGETSFDGRLNINGNIEVLGNVKAYSAVTVAGDINIGGLIKSSRIVGYPYSRYESPFNGLKLACDSANPYNMFWRQIGSYDGDLGSFNMIPTDITDASGTIYTPSDKVGLIWKCKEQGLYTITVSLLGHILQGGGIEGAVYLYRNTTKLNPPFIFNNSTNVQTITNSYTTELKPDDTVTLITEQVGATPSTLELRAGSAITFLRHC